MATIGHLAVAALLARAVTRPRDTRLQRIRRLIGASACAVAPDLDLVLRLFGVPRGDAMLSHRGASHAVILGPFVTLALIGFGVDRRDAACYGASLATHGVLDLLSDTERGPAVAWPLSRSRFMSSWRPVPSSLLTVRQFASGRGVRVLLTELILFSPVVALAMRPGVRAFYAARRARGLQPVAA